MQSRPKQAIAQQVICHFYKQKVCPRRVVSFCPSHLDWSLEDPNIAQDDPGLLTYIAKYHLEPPSSRPYNPVIVNLSEPSPQGPVIQAIFKGMVGLRNLIN